jgi:hypothetical protein
MHSDLVDKLAVEMRSNAELLLKSFVRVRGKACAKAIGSSKQGCLHFEAILPNMNFQAVQIRTIPVLQTPLSQLLHGNNPRTPHFGYLTMNQTRSLVVMDASDNAISSCPIVGVWCRLESSLNGIDLLRDPMLWGACVKYLAIDKIKDRAFIAPFTFLLVSIYNF